MNCRRQLAMAVPAGAVLALMLVGAAPARADRVEKSFTVQSKPMITVRNASGRIQVKAWDKNEVRVVCTYASGKTSLETEQVGNRIEVVTRVSEGASAEEVKVDYEITVPTATELSVRTDSGNVAVESVHGDMTFDTVGANLQLSDVGGYLVFKTVDGSVLCTRCTGKIEATSISGNVELMKPDLESVRVQTSSGNILYDGNFQSRGVYILKNFSGTIEVRFASNDSFDLSATSLKGTVVNQAAVKPDVHGGSRTPSKWGQSLFGTVNQGHAKVELSSFSGTIKILKRE